MVEIGPVIFLIASKYISYSLEKGVAISLNEFKSPSPKEALCQVWLKLAYY